MRRLLALLAVLTATAAFGCDDDDCEAGEDCECSGGHECFLGCDGDGCDQYCHDLDRCGGVCEDDCNFTCHGMQQCTSSCGEDCVIDCHDVSSCGALCGDECHYSCARASTCSVEAGANSTINCANASSCDVVCNGPCTVRCEGVPNCQVDCPSGASERSCADGTIRAAPAPEKRTMRKRAIELFLGASTALAVLAWQGEASAQSTIKTPGVRPHYIFEAEPHLLLGPFDPPGFGGGSGFGLGFRGTFDIVPAGFIRSINDSVGSRHRRGLGALRRKRRPRGRCEEYDTAPDGTRVCVDVSGSGEGADHLYLPVVMQWNFWLHRKWSVFGEPGVGLHLAEFDDVDFDPFILFLGGRFHPTENIAITARIGYPTFSIGASFFL